MPLDEQYAAEEILRMSGSATIADALAVWEAERQGMRELHDVNTALKIHNRRLRLALVMARKVISFVLAEGRMFLSPRVIGQAEEAEKQFQLVERSMTASQELTEI